MYDDYEREEIIDIAMDIFENTDATLEEAMGVAMENQMRALKAEARKTGNWDKVIMRQGLKDTGKANVADRAYANATNRHITRSFGFIEGRPASAEKASNLKSKYAEYKRPGIDKLPERFPGEANTKQYQDRASAKQREFDKRARQANGYLDKTARYPLYNMLDELNDADLRMKKMGDYSKSVPANNGRGTKYRPKASKEAAIMDTVLDFLDMYDVSLEEAIDMAYDYLID